MSINCLSTEYSLCQITDLLVLNGTLVECPGLIHGKMGVAVFFFHYARYTGNELFECYALDLIGKIQNQLHNNSPADYETGLAGIGIGMDYLMTNHFLSIDEDFFEDLDKRMVRAVMYDPWQDFSLYNGLTGYGRYWIMRLQQQTSSVQARECLLHITAHIEKTISEIPANEQTEVYCFLKDLQKITGFDICCILFDWLTELNQLFPRLENSFIRNIVRLYQRSHYFEHVSHVEINTALQQIPDLDMDMPPVNMGLLTGYAGEGMIRLTTLNQTDMSWMLLL